MVQHFFDDNAASPSFPHNRPRSCGVRRVSTGRLLYIQKPADNGTADGLLEWAGIAPATVWGNQSARCPTGRRGGFNNAGARDMQIIVATLAHPARVQPVVVKPTTVSDTAACMMG